MKHPILFLLLALLSLSAPLGASIIYVSGDQTGTWSADTVIVTAEVRVPPNMSLTILPGVKVLYQGLYNLFADSNAILTANGTPTDSILFTALNPAVGHGGLHFINSSPACSVSYAIITHGKVLGYSNDLSGGGICCVNSNITILHSRISNCDIVCIGMYDACKGGGIFCWFSNATIRYCDIGNNSAYGLYGDAYGGGICIAGTSTALIGDNWIHDNTVIVSWAYGDGGGIACIDLFGAPSPLISGNTVFGNSALGSSTGGIYCGPTTSVINSILWGNSSQQISGSPLVTYSDIQGGYAGTGNINAYPAFVDTAQGDYRLQWGSPCIDTGDPNPIYNDPDGTRADMGAWYYDQSMPVRILLTPYNAPIQIPSTGGSFRYAIQATNIESDTLSAMVWCDVTLPSGTIYGPVLGPATISLASGQTLTRVRTQAVPGNAPAGTYHYNAYAIAEGDTSSDNFTFMKLGGGGSTPALQVGGWMNTGEEFTTPLASPASLPKPVD